MRRDPVRLRMNRVRAIAVGIAAVIAHAVPARGHDRTTSYSFWTLHGSEATVTVRVAEVDLARAGLSTKGAIGAYVPGRLALESEETPCPVSVPAQVVYGRDGYVAVRYSVTCAAEGALAVRSGLLVDVLPTHLHFVRLDREGAVSERVLAATDATWLLPRRGMSTSTTFGHYVRLGFEHIMSGYDHLVFLLALLLVAGSFLSTTKVVTAFTVAHSLTLGLSVSGLVRPASGPIEALIGLSIVLLSIENVWLFQPNASLLPRLVVGSMLLLGVAATQNVGRLAAPVFAGLALFSACYYPLVRNAAKPETVRWAIAFVFGLVHGFGFASVLLEADMPAVRLATGLLGFNLGVEIGQLALVATSWPILKALVSRFGGAVVEVGSAVTIALGAYWFAGRAFG